MRYKGGELIGVTSDLIPELLDCYSELWKFNYKLYERKQTKLNEEAHFLSVIYHHLGFDESIANRYIKRMWTAVKCDNVEPGDENLALWHLPAEKKYLFERMAFLLRNTITSEEYIKELKNESHIPGLKIVRICKKGITKLKEKF